MSGSDGWRGGADVGFELAKLLVYHRGHKCLEGPPDLFLETAQRLVSCVSDSEPLDDAGPGL